MGYLPIFVDMRGRDCLVVGGGASAESRVSALVEAQAVVTLIAPEITPRLAVFANDRAIRYCAREYTAGDMRGRFMAWAATEDETTAQAMAGDARAMGILINAADRPALCDFITPAIVKRGAVQIAIGTGGASPALARRLRERLERIIGTEYGLLAEILRRVRPWLRDHIENQGERAQIMLSLIDSDLPGVLRRSDWPEVEKLLQMHLGIGLDELGLSPGSGDSNGSALPTLAAASLRAPTLRQA